MKICITMVNYRQPSGFPTYKYRWGWLQFWKATLTTKAISKIFQEPLYKLSTRGVSDCSIRVVDWQPWVQWALIGSTYCQFPCRVNNSVVKLLLGKITWKNSFLSRNFLPLLLVRQRTGMIARDIYTLRLWHMTKDKWLPIKLIQHTRILGIQSLTTNLYGSLLLYHLTAPYSQMIYLI